MDEAKIRLIIEAATEAAVKNIKSFSDESDRGMKQAEESVKSYGQSVQETWAKAKSAWLEITATVLALRKAYDMAFEAAQFKEREQAFANMAASHGVAADKIIQDLKKISANTIDTMTLMEKAGTAMMLGIDADKLDELMAIARASAKLTGQTVSKAFSDISLALGRQSRMILDNLGIIVEVEKANEQYANKLGKVASELTDAERKQAFMNATLEAGNEIVKRVGDTLDSASERMQRYQATWKNIGIQIGKIALTVLHSVDLIITGATTASNWAIRSITATFSKMFDLASRLPLIGDSVFGAWADGLKEIDNYFKGSVEWGIGHVNDTWQVLIDNWQKSEPVRTGVINDLRDQGTAAQETAEKVKTLIDLQKSDAEKRADAVKQMYEESGLNAEGYYREEVNKLAKQARTWKDAGADIEDINKYLYEKIEALEKEAFSKNEVYVADWLNTVKFHTDTMVYDLEQKEAQMQARFADIGQSIASLDGKEIGIQVELYDDDFYTKIAAMKSAIAELSSAASKVSASASSTAAGESSGQSGSGGTTIVNNFSQQVSRSDISSITSEQARQASRE